MKKRRQYDKKSSPPANIHGSFHQYEGPKLTSTERDVLFMFTEEYESARGIAVRRGTTVRAVQKILQNLKKKGIIKGYSNKVRFFECTQKSKTNHPIRLHGQEFNLAVIWKDGRFEKIREKTNVQVIDGNTVRIYRNSIEIYSAQSFWGDDAQICESDSMKYFNHFFSILESTLKIILIKPRYQNIRQVKAHFSEVENETAKETVYREDKIQIRTKDDGKIWFHVDNSYNLHEAETTHQETGKSDMQDVIAPFFNDLRNIKEATGTRPPLVSEIVGVLRELTIQNRETAAGVHAIVTMMQPKEVGIKERVVPDYIQ